MTASLYIHIPFCAGLCDYCDFFSVSVDAVNDSDLMDSFIGAVLGDVEDQLAIFGVGHVPTVYIGGGTPSVLGASRMERLLAGLQALLVPIGWPPAEFTVEANPESAAADFLRACRDGGVSRISLGVQTFHEPSRQAVRRKGGCNLLEERLALAAELFPGRLSADLITGLPFQTISVLENDIDTLMSYKPAHVSLYSLAIEPETPLGRQAAKTGAAALSLPDGDEADNLWLAGRDMLKKADLSQYEVSNFALPEKYCAHNIRYWQMENWLGAGPAASGTLIGGRARDGGAAGRRMTYAADTGAYLAAPRPRIDAARTEELSRADLIRESLLMGFRCLGGPDEGLFRRRFSCGIEDCIPATIERWRGRGFFDVKNPDGLAPCEQGLLFLNSFLRDAFGELATTH